MELSSGGPQPQSEKFYPKGVTTNINLVPSVYGIIDILVGLQR